MGRKARKRKREKKQIQEAEAKAAAERKSGADEGLFEDTEGRPLRKKAKIEVKRAARARVEEICLSWTTPAKPTAKSAARKSRPPADPLKDLWGTPAEGEAAQKKKPASCRAPANKTVNLHPK